MRRWLTCMVGVCVASQANAGPSGQVVLSNTLVAGPFAPSATVPTLTGPVTASRITAPQLRVGISGAIQVPLPASVSGWARWGLWRDQAFCDTCPDGEGPGWFGNELLGSSDLTLGVQRRFALGEDSDDDEDPAPWLVTRARSATPWVVLRADAVVPASRDALSCNPMFIAPGMGATFGLPAAGSTVQVAVAASRPFYRYDAVPVGRCAPPLDGVTTVRTLTGNVAPTPWLGDRFAASNPMVSTNAQLVWADPQAMLKGSPDALFTSLSLGLSAMRVHRDPEATVDAQTGAVAVNASNNPFRTAIPWSIQGGVAATDHVDLSLTLSNRLPTLSSDPSSLLRAQPTSTALTGALAGRF